MIRATIGISGAMTEMWRLTAPAHRFHPITSAIMKRLTAVFTERATFQTMAPGLMTLPMVIAGDRESTTVGCLIVMGNGCGCLQRDGRGLRKSRGAGHLIITGDGYIRLRLAG